ncbi:MAG: endonuclease [Planctomycetota bacterium]|nr:MAG: endonuclease [Planctomycetota bacterium]REJ91544.1 MAG: endonuclease [Planctomycetota bacterium]REK20523.1 MAG: endonuclease [Planctomycetota bacterium]REK28277.1 MAG: endonuclease [Planctomycetota bacterium]
MTPDEFRDALAQTLDDRRLSRAERRALGDVLTEANPTASTLGAYRKAAFDAVADAVENGMLFRDALDWLEGVVKLLRAGDSAAEDPLSVESFFSPGDDCLRRLQSLFLHARNRVDVCVFTITDDRITDAILQAHQRRVNVRIVTDDDKSFDLGSDIARLDAAGVPVRIDRTPDHMHHKFAVFDSVRVVTGSYNWTRSASRVNHENLVVINDPAAARSFQSVFDDLWDRFS